MLSVFGNLVVILSFSILGPIADALEPLLSSCEIITLAFSLTAFGNGIFSIASFVRPQKEVTNLGFVKDIDSNLMISSLFDKSFQVKHILTF